jgi:hypothetical protein
VETASGAKRSGASEDESAIWLVGCKRADDNVAYGSEFGIDGDARYQSDAEAGGDHLDQRAQGGCLESFVTNRIDDVTGLQGVTAQAMAIISICSRARSSQPRLLRAQSG